MLAIRMLVCTLIICCANAHAWMRMHYEDAVLVLRSEIIVVAHIKPDSIKYVSHNRRPDEGHSWEHHATLVITEVMKGKLEEKEIPIILHYGLTPALGGQFLQSSTWVRIENAAKDQVDLFDTGSGGGGTSASHIEKDHIWFLRRRSGIYGREPGTGNFGVVDPEDIQELELKAYFSAYFEKDAEAAVKSYVVAHPELAKRAKSYLDHLEVQRIKQIPDVDERIKKLIPYFLVWQYWYSEDRKQDSCEAKSALIACGDKASAALIPYFEQQQKPRQWIIEFWSEAHYKGAVDPLIALLIKHDVFWSRQQLNEGWWNAIQNPETEHRRDVYGEVYNSVCALRQIGDPKAKEAIELTLKRWQAISFSNPQIVEECQRALATWK